MGAADAENERTQHPHPAEDRDREAVLGGDLLETAFALAPVGLALIGLDGRFIRANRGACRILGWPESELRGRSLHDITVPEDRLSAVAEIRQLLAGERDECRAVKRVHDSKGEPVAVMLSVAVARDAGGTPRHFVVALEDACSDRAAELAGVNEELRRTITDQQGGAFERTLMRADGERFEAVVTAAPARDAAGNPIGFVNTVRDVSAERRQRRELERLARTDSLTGLANRHVLHESLRREAGRRSGEEGRLALVLLDIDRFKQVNDAYGHPTGDAVLVEVARRLECAVRAHEVLARVGGEEFALVLPGCTHEDAVAAADRARAAISARPFLGAGMLTMSAAVVSSPRSVVRAPKLAGNVRRHVRRRARRRGRWLPLGVGGRGRHGRRAGRRGHRAATVPGHRRGRAVVGAGNRRRLPASSGGHRHADRPAAHPRAPRLCP